MKRLAKASPRVAVGVGHRVSVSVGLSGSARHAKGSSSSARGYGYRWQKARAAFLAENPLCAMCSSPSSPVAASVVDHIIPHGGDDGLFWDRANWQPLCKRCHDSIKQRQDRARRDG